MSFASWLENLMEFGLSHAIQKYYSIYPAKVTDNQDPKGLGRVKILCDSVGQTSPPDVWVLPAMAGAGNKRGMFFVPEKDDTVFISFFEGDPNKPTCYWGGWYGLVDGSTPDVPDGIAPKSGGFPEKKGFTTRAGHSLIFNDEAGKESVTLLWNKPADGDAAKTDRTKTAKLNPQKSSVLSFDPNGGFFLKTASSYLIQIDEAKGALQIVSPKGSMFTMSSSDVISMIHKSGASISITDSAINISGKVSAQMNVNISGQTVSLNAGGVLLGGKAVDFAVLGLKLVAWLAKHTHPFSFGTTLAPLPPPAPSDFLSKTVKVQE